ncbi:MAG: hypothetical protein RL213_501 [Bacteroidota bacterium]
MTEAAITTFLLQREELLRTGRTVQTVSGHRTTADRQSSICGTCSELGVENGWSFWDSEEGENVSGFGLQFSGSSSPSPPRFAITGGNGIDTYTPGLIPGDPPIPVVAPAGFGLHSIRLGELSNDGIGGGCNAIWQSSNQVAAGCAERLTYCFNVGLLDTNFIYAYAFVMENPGNSHSNAEMPYVEFMMLDAAGDTIPCSYKKYIANENFPGQYICNQARPNVAWDPPIYKPWSVEGVNLSGYIGQTVTVVITNADCRLGGHFAHSYWDFACGSTAAVYMPTCYVNAPDTFVAPQPPDNATSYSYLWFRNHDVVPFDSVRTTIAYSQPGDTFVVKITTPSGCSWYSRYVPQHYQINAAFEVSVGCDYALFIDSSNTTSGNYPATSWSWSFPGGTPGTYNQQQPPAVTFTPGDHTVTLIAGTSSPGCSDTVTQVVRVPLSPIAAFTAPTVCVGSPVSFVNLSDSLSADSIATYSWSFPGGQPSASLSNSPSVTYPAPGSWPISLTVTTSDGCVDSVQQNVNVNPDPFAVAAAPSVCFGIPVQTVNSSYALPAGSALQFDWTFPGGTPNVSSSPAPVVNYPAPGDYSATLVATTSGGCSDSVVLPIKILPLPEVGFTSNPLCEGATTVFSNLSNVPSGSAISTYEWSFPGGSPSVSYAVSPSVSYPAAGTFDATLIAVTDDGCSDSLIQPVTVHSLPLPAFSNGDSACAPLCLRFYDFSTNADGAISSWNWNFPGSTTAVISGAGPAQVCYDQPGIYGGSLEVVTADGCRARVSVERLVRVYANPVADYSVTNPEFDTRNPSVGFRDRSSADAVMWEWSFGDGTPSVFSGPETTHSYAAAIPDNDFYTFLTSLVVTNVHGCMDTITRPVDARPLFSFYIPNAFTPNGDNENSTFYGKGMGIREYELLVFDRWGLEVYRCRESGSNVPWDRTDQEGMSSSCKWDGRVDGQPAQSDVYVWKVRLTDVFGEQHSYIGRVTLLY